jgi:hypothetical protein
MINWYWFKEYGFWLGLSIIVLMIIIEINSFVGLDKTGIIAEQFKIIRNNFINDLFILISILILAIIVKVSQIKKE